MEIQTANIATHPPAPPLRRPQEMSAAEIHEQVRAIIAGTISGGSAVEALRLAVRLCYADEDALAERRAAIEKAEATLVYGAAGRPARQYSSSFGISNRG